MIKCHIELILRVLYRLRSLAEQTPYDSATYCYTSPLINSIISSGGKNAVGTDEALEQLTLALDFIRFHCSQCTYRITIDWAFSSFLQFRMSPIPDRIP